VLCLPGCQSSSAVANSSVFCCLADMVLCSCPSTAVRPKKDHSHTFIIFPILQGVWCTHQTMRVRTTNCICQCNYSNRTAGYPQNITFSFNTWEIWQSKYCTESMTLNTLALNGNEMKRYSGSFWQALTERIESQALTERRKERAWVKWYESYDIEVERKGLAW
jgi:hypothetical protein